MKRQCLGMMQSKQWIPLKKLVSPEWESSSFSPDEIYPELGGFVEYLYETYGVDRLQQIWKGGSKSHQESLRQEALQAGNGIQVRLSSSIAPQSTTPSTCRAAATRLTYFPRKKFPTSMASMPEE
jgi:hypothetical protein